MMRVPSKIFREYDIRGVVGEDITKETANLLGRAFAKYILQVNGLPPSNAHEIILSVGRDVRLHSQDLCNGLIEGITSTGVNVIDVGVCPTPCLYFSLYNTGADGGVMITGSHNPPEFNGFKLCAGKEALYGESIQEIRQIVEEEALRQEKVEGGVKKGHVEFSGIVPFYLAYLREQFVFPYEVSRSPVKVVVDSGNGTAGVVAPTILREMGCEVIELYSEPDGRFPNHHPDPTIPENLKDLITSVRENNADLGVAYDGDADRIGIVDEGGGIIWGDRLMVIYAREILKERPGATIVSEVKASQVLYDEIEKAGGNPIMWKAGHSLIKAKMKETKAVLGGEVSGHIFFADIFFGYDDAIYVTCRLIEILKRERVARGKGQEEVGDIASGLPDEQEVRRGVSFLLEGVPVTCTTPEIRVPCSDDKKFQVVEEIKEFFTSNLLPAQAKACDYRPPIKDIIKTCDYQLPVKDIITIDGVRVIFEHGWGLIRPSNTQPVLVLRFEANSQERLTEIRSFLEDVLNQVAGSK